MLFCSSAAWHSLLYAASSVLFHTYPMCHDAPWSSLQIPTTHAFTVASRESMQGRRGGGANSGRVHACKSYVGV